MEEVARERIEEGEGDATQEKDETMKAKAGASSKDPVVEVSAPSFDLTRGSSVTESLFVACERGHAKKLKEMIAKGVRTFAGISSVDVNAEDSDGFTPLMIAAACSRPACVKVLLDSGAKTSLVTYELSCTALHLAARAGQVECVRLLTEANKALIDVKNTKGETPLFWACIGGHTEVVRYFVSQGATVDGKNRKGITTVMAAVTVDAVDLKYAEYEKIDRERSIILNLLLEKSKDLVNVQDKEGATAVHLAGCNGLPRCVQGLLKAGADITIRDDGGNTALRILTALRQSEICPGIANINIAGRKNSEAILRMEWQRLERKSTQQILELFGEDAGDISSIIGSGNSEKRAGRKKRSKRGGKRKGRRGKRKKGGKNASDTRTSETSSDLSKAATSSSAAEDLPVWKEIMKKAPRQHVGVVCDGCYADKKVSKDLCPDIFGARYKCFVCEDYDLCERCFLASIECGENSRQESSHGPGHSFVCFTTPTSRGSHLASKHFSAEQMVVLHAMHLASETEDGLLSEEGEAYLMSWTEELITKEKMMPRSSVSRIQPFLKRLRVDNSISVKTVMRTFVAVPSLHHLRTLSKNRKASISDSKDSGGIDNDTKEKHTIKDAKVQTTGAPGSKDSEKDTAPVETSNGSSSSSSSSSDEDSGEETAKEEIQTTTPSTSVASPSQSTIGGKDDEGTWTTVRNKNQSSTRTKTISEDANDRRRRKLATIEPKETERRSQCAAAVAREAVNITNEPKGDRAIASKVPSRKQMHLLPPRKSSHAVASTNKSRYSRGPDGVSTGFRRARVRTLSQNVIDSSVSVARSRELRMKSTDAAMKPDSESAAGTLSQCPDRMIGAELDWMRDLDDRAPILALTVEHWRNRRLSELSASQLDVLEDMHIRALRSVREARMELVRANERARCNAQRHIENARLQLYRQCMYHMNTLAFRGSSLEEIVFDATMTAHASLDNLPLGLRYVGNEAFLNCHQLHVVDFKDAGQHAEGTVSEAYILYIGDKAFRDCNSLETLSLPYLQDPFSSSIDDIYSENLNNIETWRGTDSLTCFIGPSEYVMPCSTCASVGDGNERFACDPEEETVQTTTERAYAQTTSATLIDDSAPDKNAGDVIDVLTVVSVVFALLFVGAVAVFWLFVRAGGGRRRRLDKVAPFDTKSVPTLSPNISESSYLSKTRCMELVDKENLRWDKNFEEVYSLIQDERGYCDRQKFHEVLIKRVNAREAEKLHERTVGAKLFAEAMQNADHLSALPDEWRSFIVPKESPKGRELFEAIHDYESVLIEKRSLSDDEFRAFSALLNKRGPDFFRERIDMYERVLSKAGSNAESQIARLTTNLDARYKRTYDEIFKMQISIGDSEAYQRWRHFARSTSSLPHLRLNKVVQKTRDLPSLYKDAVLVIDEFNSICTDVAESSGGEYIRAPVKHAFRALEKVALQHDKGRRSNCDNIADVVRGSIVYDSMDGVLRGAQALVSGKLGFVITRFKDRFSEGNETSGGWRDAMFNGYIVDKDDKNNNRHVVEIQLQHKALLLVRSDLGGHFIYAKFRSLMEALETCKGEDEMRRARAESRIGVPSTGK
eukprot:g1666.t1